MLAGFLVGLMLPLPTLGGTGEVTEVAEEGDKYGVEGFREISFRLDELSSSGTLLRPRLVVESIR